MNRSDPLEQEIRDQSGTAALSPQDLRDLPARLRLHVITDKQWSKGRDTVEIVRGALNGGATVIQLRDKNANTRELVQAGHALRMMTREAGALLIVNDRVDVAVAVDADGAHIGADDLPVDVARRILGPERILGVSAGSLEEAERAVQGGADYLGVGPIYETQGKADAGRPVGLQLLKDLSQRYALPLVGIGGITDVHTPEVIKAGASGVAVITAVVAADDITAATLALGAAIERGLNERMAAQG